MSNEHGWVRRLWGYLLRHRRDVSLAVLAAVLGSSCQAVVPLVARQIVDGVIIDRNSSLWPWLLLLLAVAVLFGSWAKVSGVDQPKPELAFRPAAAGAGQAWRKVTLEFLLRERTEMTQNTGVLAVDDNGAATLWIPGASGQRCRNGIAHDDGGWQFFPGGERRQCQHRADQHSIYAFIQRFRP